MANNKKKKKKHPIVWISPGLLHRADSADTRLKGRREVVSQYGRADIGMGDILSSGGKKR